MAKTLLLQHHSSCWPQRYHPFTLMRKPSCHFCVESCCCAHKGLAKVISSVPMPDKGRPTPKPIDARAAPRKSPNKALIPLYGFCARAPAPQKQKMRPPKSAPTENGADM